MVRVSALGRSAATAVVGPPRQVAFSLSHALGAAADSFVTVSLAGSLFFNVSPNASRTQVLLYLIITLVPFTVLVPFVGPTVDRFPRGRRAVGAVCYLLRSLCCIAMALTLYQLRFYVFALILLVVAKASGVVKYALVPHLVDDPSQLIATNSRLARLATVTGGVFGSLAIALQQATGPSTVLVAAAVLLAAAMLAIALVPPGTHGPAPRSVEFTAVHSPSVVNAAFGLGVIRASVGFFVFMLAFTLRRDSEPAWVYGMALTAYGAGLFLANVVAPYLRRRHQEERLMLYSLIAPAAVTAAATLGVGRPIVVVTAIVIGLATTTGRLSFDGLLQRTAPDETRGRAFARYETRFQVSWVVGAVLATAITLPAEVSMGLLTAVFVPAIVVYVRGARESRRYDVVSHVDPSTSALAITRLATARAWQRADSFRQAVIDAAAAVDLARAVGAAGDHVGDDVAIDRLGRLRLLAIDPAREVGHAEAEQALQLAEHLVARDTDHPDTEPV